MSSNAYDKTSGLLHQIAGIPKSILNTLIAKTDAALNNQASSIEPTTTATSAHLVGDYIIYGLSRKYAKVTSAIAIGDTIANGTNVSDITQGEVLTQLNASLPKKLWTNPELDSTGNLTYFAAQKVSIPTLSNYKYIKILYCYYDRSNQQSGTFINKVNFTGILDHANTAPSSGYFVMTKRRYFTINSDGITFEDNQAGNVTTSSVSNAYCIPLEIWGSNTP